ncbi:hypothetical protein BJY01DRAFT_222781 [Aspergillus pseudoustus]|uniref:Secreted protein n=1 Tax=Aspergillus pseudoustus TaxID=1810923 RepID=A0ABR4J7X3_9EURO
MFVYGIFAVLVHQVGRSRQVACHHFASFEPYFSVSSRFFCHMSQPHLTFSVCARSCDLEAMFQGIDDGPGRWVLAASSLDSPVWRDHRFLALCARHELCLSISGLQPWFDIAAGPNAEAPSGMDLHSRYLAFVFVSRSRVFSSRIHLLRSSATGLFGEFYGI